MKTSEPPNTDAIEQAAVCVGLAIQECVSESIHFSIFSIMQTVHGVPCSTTLQAMHMTPSRRIPPPEVMQNLYAATSKLCFIKSLYTHTCAPSAAV